MRRTVTACLLAAISAPAPGPASGNEPPTAAIDFSQWKCKYCEFEEGWSGSLELGPGYLSRDSFKFGEYSGIKKEGAYAVVNGTLRYRDTDAYYLDLFAHDLGLNSRTLSLEGGRQGKYDLVLRYDEIPHYISDTVSTPFSGSGSESLTLPPGWTDAETTAGLGGLSAAQTRADLSTRRKRLEVGATYIQTPRWEYSATYRRDSKKGRQRAAGAFYFNGSQLVEPVDYITDELDAAVSYSSRKWQARFAYYGSVFRNDDTALTWDNPFTPLDAGALTGQQAMAPDNQFHQVFLSAAYAPSDRTRVTGDIALGRMTQDENFRPATLNATLGAIPLPRQSLDGEVDTLSANFRVLSTPTRNLRLNGTLTYNDRDNKTPESSYTWVTTDTSVASPRTNLPYSFTRSTLKMNAEYRLRRGTKLSAGFDYENHERTLQEIDETDEGRGWAKMNVRLNETTDLMLEIARAERDASGLGPAPGVDPPENPLMRKYNLADRDRDSVVFKAHASPVTRLAIGVDINYANDNYTDSALGLTDGREFSFNADASILVGERTSVYFFGGREKIRSRQRGSENFSTPDWLARNDDTIDTGGFGIKHRMMNDRLDLGLDYTITKSTGEINISGNAGYSEFPDLETLRNTVRLYGTYRLKETLDLNVALWHERYATDDWAVDDVSPDTVPKIIVFGEDSPSYDVNVISVSALYRF